MGAILTCLMVVVLVACGPAPEGDPAVLEGITAIRMQEVPPEPPTEEFAVSRIVDDHRIVVEYNGGPVCVNDPWRQQPGAVTAVFGAATITVLVDTGTRGCHGSAEAAQFRASAELTLMEEHLERTITVLPMGDGQH